MIKFKEEWKQKYEYYDICKDYVIVNIHEKTILKENAPEEARVAFEKLMNILKEQGEYEKEIGMSIRG